MLKTLFIDIETSPNIVLSWRIGSKINIGIDSIVSERKIICICYKWAHENKTRSLVWSKKQCDKDMLKKISAVLNTADEVVGHNGDKFDLKFINGRLAFHDLSPLAPVATTDTLKQSRRVFYINSHKLDYISQYFGLGKKVKTGGIDLWKDILLNKSEPALNKMVKYCKMDVILLEKVYNKLNKYTKGGIHKGRAEGNGSFSCRNGCGVNHLSKNGVRLTAAGVRHQRYTCTKCGAKGSSLYRQSVTKARA